MRLRKYATQAARTTSFLETGDFDHEKLDPQTVRLSSCQLCLTQCRLGQKPMGQCHRGSLRGSTSCRRHRQSNQAHRAAKLLGSPCHGVGSTLLLARRASQMRCPLQSSRSPLRATRRNLGPTSCRNLHRPLLVLGSNPQISRRWHGYSHEKPVSSSPKGCRKRVSMRSENQLPRPTRLRLRTFRLRGFKPTAVSSVSVDHQDPIWRSFKLNPLRRPVLLSPSKSLSKQSLPKTNSIRTGLAPTFMAHRSIWPPRFAASLLKGLLANLKNSRIPHAMGAV